LSTVRAQVILGSVYARDALLDPDSSSANEYRRQIETTYDAVDQALQAYVPVLDSAAERDRVDHLRREIAEFRETMVKVLATDSRTWPRDARLLLSTQIVPKRQLVIRVSEEVQALNRSAFVRQQSGITEIYDVTQRRVWETLGFALAASFGVGLLATI
jgi:hypothetical protein